MPLTPTAAVELVAPHTWPASVLPVLLAGALTMHDCPENFSPLMFFVLLAISILMQSSANVINDYADFVRGADTADNQPDKEDSAMVYRGVSPAAALTLFFLLMATAGALGAYVVWKTGWIPLVIGAIGAATVCLYSVGKKPISYLPLGELTSGFVMGGLITLASSTVLTGAFSWRPLLYSIPLIFGIGLIMCTNNTCDIEKDIQANRKTFSAIVGRVWARRTYHLFVYLWIASIVTIVAVFFPAGWIILPVYLIASYPPLRALLSNPLILNSRIAAMGQILTVNLVMTTFYVIAIFADKIMR